MNPVLRKDLTALLRAPRVGAMQVAFIAVLALLVLATWPQQGFVSLAMRGRDDLLLGLIVGQLGFLALAVPGVAAISISGEKEANTFEMLYASRLTAAQVITGKVGSAISFPLLLLLTGLPFIALLNCRGELDAPAMGAAYAVLGAAAILLAVVSLTVSALCRDSASALVIAYTLVLLICGGSLVPAAILLDTQEGLPAAGLHFLRSLSPVSAVLSLLHPQPGDFDGRVHELPAAWRIFLPASAVIVLACAALLISRLRRPPAETASPRHVEMILDRSLGRRIMFLIDPRKQRRPIGSLNPLLVNEARTNGLRSGRWMIRIFYGVLVISLLLAGMSLNGGTEHPDLLAYVARVMVLLQLGVVGLVTPALTAGSISSELESGTFELLRLTPLRPWQVFWGKLLPSLGPAFLPVLAMAPAYAAICWIDPTYLLSLWRLLGISAMGVAFCAALGLTCSALAGNTSRATVVAYLLAAIVFAVPLLAWWASGTQLAPEIARRLCLPSPLIAGLNVLPGAPPEVAAAWQAHLLVLGALTCVLLAVAAGRLWWLLERS